MKTFIVLTFIGILTCACANFVTISECKNPRPMTGFSATKFFQGTWYVTHVKNVTGANVCQSFSTSTPSDGKYVTEYSLNQNDGTNVRCEAGREEDQKLTFSCKRGGVDIYQAVFVVLGTDYNDYAVFYRCIIFTSGTKADNYLALSRTSGNEDIYGAQGLIKDLELQKCSGITFPPVA